MKISQREMILGAATLACLMTGAIVNFDQSVWGASKKLATFPNSRSNWSKMNGNS